MFPSPSTTLRRAAALLTLVVALLAGAVPALAGTKAQSTLSVADSTGPESGSRSFTVTLSRAATRSVTVRWATVDGTAVAGQDYVVGSGSVSIPAGSTQRVVTVAVVSDTVDEPDEGFTVRLSSPDGAAIADGEATGTLVDDDLPPTPPPTAGPVTPNSPIVASVLDQGEGRDLDMSRPFLTRSISPASDALVVVQMALNGSPATLPAQVQGAGLRFDLLAELRPRPDTPRTVGYYVAQARTTPGPVSLTWAPGASPVGGVSYTVTQYRGVAVGANGRAALAQVQTDMNHVNATTTEGHLDPLRDPVRNAVAAFYMVGTRGQDIVPEPSYAKVAAVIGGASMFSLEVSFSAGGNDLTPSVTWAKDASNLWLALELVAAP